MDVELIRDSVCRQNFTMAEGAIIEDVREFKHVYRGMFYPMHGGNPYFVTVPKEDCKSLTSPPSGDSSG